MSTFVTLLLSDGYLKGAQVLGHSLRDLDTKHELAIMVTPNVSESALAGLLDIYDQIIEVEPIYNPSTDNLNLLGRLDLRASLTKVNLWRQVQYEKVVFLDADMVVLQNIDHLFDLDVEFAAAPDVGWPDIFNSGVFFAKPNIGTYAALRRLTDAGVSFDGGDQGLLNTFFPSFHRLSFTYNVTPSSSYQYLPAYRYFQSQVKVVHFIGSEKPWHRGQDENSPVIGGSYGELLAHWWSVYWRHYPGSYQGVAVPKVRNRSHMSPPRAVLDTIEEDEQQSRTTDSPPPFEASRTGWDAQLSSPPLEGRPEAADLQFMSYSNSWDRACASESFFPPPTPRIPKSVHFEPPSTPDPSKRVFPWEGTTVAQRSFPEDAIAPLQEIYTIERNETPQSEADEPEQADSFKDYTFSNAWDSVQEIKDYIANMAGSTSRPRAPSSAWGASSDLPHEAELPEGPSKTVPLSTRIPGAQESLKTDFMLLQGPADLPRPQDWDPSAQLAALASQAVTLAQEAAERKAQSSSNTSGAATPTTLTAITQTRPLPAQDSIQQPGGRS